MIITEEWIHKYKTPNNGWTKIQLSAIGISWPPKKGWLKKSVGKEISDLYKGIFEREYDYYSNKKNKQNNIHKTVKVKKKKKRSTKLKKGYLYNPESWITMPNKINGQNNYGKYQLYIKSKQWKEFRLYALKEHGEFCNRCKKEGVQLHVHHLTYERLFKESIYDVEILCVPCHKKEHEPKKQNKPKRITLTTPVS